MRSSKKISTRVCVEACLAQGMTSPSLIRDELAKQGKKVTAEAITMTIKRLGIDRKAIEQKVKLEKNKDIQEHHRVQDYLQSAKHSKTTRDQINRQLTNITRVWRWMGQTPPETWTYKSLTDMLETHYPMRLNKQGYEEFEQQGAVMKLLSAVSTFFPNILPEGWSGAYTREAGSLKDYFTFEEAELFINALEDTETMSQEGWQALFKSQLNIGCREGTKENTGILSLMWEDINYETRRCSLHEKGGKGKAGRIWNNLPLDLFPWLNGWLTLETYHVQKFGHVPTKDHHATGRVFPLNYDTYLKHFHATRKRCNSRISGDLETMRPHVLRRTHAQWLVKLKVPLQHICGQFPDGYFGVGWDNPTILLKYYVTLEPDEGLEIMAKARTQMEKLGLDGRGASLPLASDTTKADALPNL